jgi:hypothetical protein
MAVSEADVLKIYPTAGSADLSGFLATAQAITAEYLTDVGLSSTLQDQVTIYLAAHFAVLGLEGGGLQRKKMGEADESYKTPGDKDLGFKSTRFGQMALILDSSGTLASIGAASSGLSASFEVVGDEGRDRTTS